MHVLEYKLFHLQPYGYHTVNLVIHVANTALVYFFIRKYSQQTLIGLMAALLFGLHPMHVESVAWASELKDVLYTIFLLWLPPILSPFPGEPSNKMVWLDTDPFYSFLIIQGHGRVSPVGFGFTGYHQREVRDKSAWIKKIPFFVLSLVFGIVAIYAQRSESALHGDIIGWGQRIVFASYSFILYLQKLIVPYPLYAYYPYPVSAQEAIPLKYYLFPFLSAGVLAGMVYAFRKYKHVFFGISFFTATIFMVLKFLPVSFALMADRYVYVPSVGICLLAGVGLQWLINGSTPANRKAIALAILTAFGIVFGMLTTSRCHVWKNSLSLWTDVIEKNKNIPVAYANRAVYYNEQKQYELAKTDIDKALQLNADYTEAYFDKGLILQGLNQNNEALAAYDEVIRQDPGFAKAYINRGTILRDAGRPDTPLRIIPRASPWILPFRKRITTAPYCIRIKIGMRKRCSIIIRP